MKPQILTLTGPSCAGKSTMEKMLREKHGFVPVISTTTRPMRAGEVDGQSYYFVDRKTFQDMAERGQFVENVEFNGNFYGVSAQEVERVAAYGKPIVLIVEPQGLHQIQDYAIRAGWDVLSVFITNPPQVIARRFMERYTADLALSLGNGVEASGKVVDDYSRRLGIMLDEEVFWQDGCALDTDVLVDSFDESNTQEILDHITSTFYEFCESQDVAWNT